MPNQLRIALRTALAASLAVPVTAWAQDPAPVGLGEVIVTAQKREQSLQEVPLAVSAFTGEFIQQARLGDIRGLVDFTPGFSGRTEDSFTDALAIRGIATNDFGIGGDPSVAIFTDGVWAGRTGGVQTSFYDIERAEVVKGPQGTLFGRNAIAGAVSIITNRPVAGFEADTELSVADYDHLEATATVNLPLNDRWFLRGSAYGLTNDGFLVNTEGGGKLGEHDVVSTRWALRYAGERADLVLTAAYEEREQHPSVYWVPADGLPDDRVASDLGDSGFDESDILEARLNAEWSLANDWTLTSITGFKTFEFDYLEDYDGGPTQINDYRQFNDVDYVSQELRLNSAPDGRVVWFAGVSGYREKIDGFFEFIYTEDDLCRAIGITDAPDFSGPVAGCDDPNFEEYWGEDIDPADLLAGKSESSAVELESQGWAVYGDATFHLTESLEMTIGARYTWDRKEIRSVVFDSGGALGNNFNYEFYTDGFVANQEDWSDFTPRIAFNLAASDNLNLYLTGARGYKSGGFATFGFDLQGQDPDDDGLAPPGTRPIAFEPEEVDSFEFGAKARLLDDRLQLNTALFHYRYQDLQLVYFDTGSSLVANVGEAEGRGLEADLRFVPNASWDLRLGLSLLDTEITDATDIEAIGACGDCAGNQLPFAPEVTSFAVATWRRPLGAGELSVTGEHHYQDVMYGGPDNIPDAATDSWHEFSFRIGYHADSGWGVTLWVENAFDEQYFERGWENADADNQFGYGLRNELVWPARPRTVGLTFSKRWN